MTTWFTADRHFGHRNIIRYCNRPFASVEEMDRELIHRHNARVRPTDTYYDVGDFSLADHSKYLPHLNGRGVLILGNHDNSRVRRHAGGWREVYDLLATTVGDTSIVMCHYAMRVWPKSHYGALHFYGHSHGTLPGDSQCLDVGVDCWGFQPISLLEIQNRLATNPRRGDPHAAAFAHTAGG